MCQSCKLFVSEALVCRVAGIEFTYTLVRGFLGLAILINRRCGVRTDLRMKGGYILYLLAKPVAT